MVIKSKGYRDDGGFRCKITKDEASLFKSIDDRRVGLMSLLEILVVDERERWLRIRKKHHVPGTVAHMVVDHDRLELREVL